MEPPGGMAKFRKKAAKAKAKRKQAAGDDEEMEIFKVAFDKDGKPIIHPPTKVGTHAKAERDELKRVENHLKAVNDEIDAHEEALEEAQVRYAEEASSRLREVEEAVRASTA